MRDFSRRTSALCLALCAGLAFAAPPRAAAEANVDVDAGVQDPATPINPLDAYAGGTDVDVSVDGDAVRREPGASKPDISIETPGTRVDIDRN